MPKLYVSNSEKSIRMFKSDFLESLSKVRFYVPLIIYIPVIGIFIWYALAKIESPFLYFIELFILGVFIWTLTEYVLHRFLFHFISSAGWAKRIIWTFHGVHHDYPRDKLRLVMPPSASIPLATLFFFLFLWICGKPAVFSFFPGFLLGYLIYDMMHYALHHYRFKSSVMHTLMKHHALHHYKDESKAYGVSSPLWDYVFHTNFPKEDLKTSQRTE